MRLAPCALGLVVFHIACAVAAPGRSADEADELDLLERARENARTTWHWTDRQQTLSLTIADGRGNERVRKLVMFTRREPEGGEKSLAVFVEPTEVRGSAFLQHSPPRGSPAQWLFLPKLERPRRIASKAKRRSFMGSDFSYADLAILENALLWRPEDVEAEAVPGAPGRFRLRQKIDDPPYDHIVIEFSESDAWMRAMEMHDSPDGGATKLLRFEAIREESGIPTSFHMVLEQPANGSTTTVDVSNLTYDGGLSSSLFTKRALASGLDHVD